MKYEVVYTIKNIYKIEVEADSREAAFELAEEARFEGDISMLDTPDDTIVETWVQEV